MVVKSSDNIEILGKKYIIEKIDDSLIIDNKTKSPILIYKNPRSWRLDLDIMHSLDDLLLSGLNGQVFDFRKNTLYYVVNGITLQSQLSFKANQEVVITEDGQNYIGDIFNNKNDLYEHLGAIINLFFKNKGKLSQNDFIERSILIYGEGPTEYFWQSETKENSKQLNRGYADIVPIRIADNETARMMRLFILEAYISQFEKRMMKDIPREEIECSTEFKFHVFTIQYLRKYFMNQNNSYLNSCDIMNVQKYMKELSLGIKEFLQSGCH